MVPVQVVRDLVAPGRAVQEAAGPVAAQAPVVLAREEVLAIRPLSQQSLSLQPRSTSYLRRKARQRLR